ncbi:RNA polymerase sigma factor [Streptomyces sp. GTA36]
MSTWSIGSPRWTGPEPTWSTGPGPATARHSRLSTPITSTSYTRYLLFRTRNRHLAEDLTQEVFIKALRHIESFTWQGTAFTAWLLTIARNLHLDEVRTKRSRLETLVSEVGDGDTHDRSAESGALHTLETIETREAVWNALRTLNSHQRQCMELRFIGEMSPEETACAMGRTVGAVKALTFRARQKLRAASEREAAA